MADPSSGDPRGDRPGAGADRPRTWDRIRAVFEEAVSLDSGAQDALLRRVAAEDPALADEVRSLLASHHEAGDFLEPPDLFRGLAPGERVGPYRVVEEIGRGGMGVVYRAVRDDEHFTKEVAIKLIDPGMRSDAILRRFRAERQILAMLDHPHIARLVDGGSASDGSPYLVMEHVSGVPLVKYCDDQGLGTGERLRLFLVVCDAVAFAHQRLIVHRDLKSDNILVAADGSPKLLDFGIAKLLSEGAGEKPGTVTAPMHRMLTPDYASPEQVRGEPVTVASDVYSLGVVLYELLTGTRPLHFETRSAEEILRVVTEEEPAAPSAVVARTKSAEVATRRRTTVTRLRRRLAGDLDYIVLKALEKDPSRRYASVGELARDVQRCLENLPVLARGRTTAYLLSRLVRRHRVAVATAAAVLLTLLAGLATTAWQARVASVERDRAQRRFKDVRMLARAVIFDIHDAIQNLPGSTKAREILVQHALEYLDRLSREAGDDPSLLNELGVAYGKIGDVQGRPEFSNLGRTADARRSYERSMELLQAASRAQPDSLEFGRNLVLTKQRLGDLLSQMGQKDEAMRLAQEGKRWILAALARHPENELLPGDLGVACDRISDMRFAAGDTVGALQELLGASPVVTALYQKDPDDPQRKRSAMVGYAKTAYLLAMTGERPRAGEDYRTSQELALELVRTQPHNVDAVRDLGVVYGMRAMFFADAGEFDSALVLYEKGVKLSEDLAASNPDDVLQQVDLAKGRYETGMILLRAGRHREAEERFRDAYRRFSDLAERDASNTELRAQMARASRKAGEACAAMAARSGASEVTVAWRSKAADWYSKSLDLYRSLAAGGSLAGAEAGAPDEVSKELAALR
ncbi:MAG TPA: protein kinase [Candidatus Eisenbacteria bacterium]|nr:protein kinase [Candidatus Eisenbacteria bacterium]